MRFKDKGREKVCFIGQFLGTGDAQGIPGAFCRCSVCDEARRIGGNAVRHRSCFRLSNKTIIDLGADAVLQAAKFGDFSELEYVLITHTHEDHINVHMIMELVWGRKSRRSPLHFYLTDKAYDIVEQWRNTPWIIKGSLAEWEKQGLVVFHQLKFGERTQIDDYYVTPYRGNHFGNMGEDSAMYFIELSGGQNIFYGLDSGIYYPDTLSLLRKTHIDLFISEATIGISDSYHPHHMRLTDVHKLIEDLFSFGALTVDTTVYLTHINHSSSHNDMLSMVEKLKFPVKTVVAYDGLKIF